MILRLAWHELRQQVTGRVFWIVFAVSVLMVVGAMVIDDLRVGQIAGAPTQTATIVRTHLVWSLFFLFTAAALVGEAVLRDQASGFEDLIRSTPVSRGAYALGRFVGAFGGVLLCFTSVPLALAAGGAALGFGSGAAGIYAFALLVLALPNLVLASALFFALARITRSMTGCLLGAAGLLTLYGLLGEGSGVSVSGLLEPFGFAALPEPMKEWGRGQDDALGPVLGGALIANRLLWLSVAAGLIGLGAWLSARDGYGWSRPRVPRKEVVAAAPLTRNELERSRSHQRSEWKLIVTQLLVRTSFEARRTIQTPAFAALLVMGLAAAVAAASKVTGTPSTIAALTTSFQLVPVVVVLFFAGELFWADREHNVTPIITVTPVAEAVLVFAKFLALALVLLSLAAVNATGGAVTELVKGSSPVPWMYLAWYIVPQTFDWLLLGALALFLQSLAPNKLAGWGYLVLYLIGSLALDQLSWRDRLYRYGAYPGAPLPAVLSGAHDVGWYRVGWGAVAMAMIALACRRGVAGGHPAKPAASV